MQEKKKSAFEASSDGNDTGLLREFLAMMKENKKYWLIPLVLTLLFFGMIVILGSGAAAPFIYTLF